MKMGLNEKIQMNKMKQVLGTRLNLYFSTCCIRISSSIHPIMHMVTPALWLIRVTSLGKPGHSGLFTFLYVLTLESDHLAHSAVFSH